MNNIFIRDFVILLATIVVLAACDAKRENSIPANKTERLINSDISLLWVGDSKNIIVDQQWLFNLKNKAFSRIKFPLQQAATSNPRSGLYFLVNSDLVLQFDGTDTLIFNQIGQNVASQPVNIPIWLPAEPGSEPVVLSNIVFWLNKNQVFNQQIDTRLPNRYTCGVYQIDVKKWHNLERKNCLESSFFHLFAAKTVGAGRVVALSAAEGQQAVDFIEFTETNKFKFIQKNIDSLLFSSPAPDQIQKQSDSDKLITLVFPCVMDDTENIQCKPDSEQQGIVYDWILHSGKLQRRFPQQKFSVAVAPTKNEYAWINDDKLCVGVPADTDVSCIDLPNIQVVAPR